MRTHIMSVVIISSEAYCHGEEIAKKAARLLGYACIGREVLAMASQRFGIPEGKLQEALWDSPSFLSKFSNTRMRHLAYFQAALTAILKKGHVVYHGKVGHMFVSGVSHVVKVRLTADMEDRIAERCAEEKISEKRALELFEKEAANRRKWFQSVFGVNGEDEKQFDLIINVSEVGPDRAATIICETARDVKFSPVTYSIKAMQDQELASRVRAALIDTYPDVKVSARDGDVSISAKTLRREKKEKILSLREQIQGMEGVSYVQVGWPS